MTMVTSEPVTISLGTGCSEGREHCNQMSWRLYRQMIGGPYARGASVMRIPHSIQEYLAAHRTTRKRVLRAERLGHTFAEIDRPAFEADVNAINRSTPERQGRPMSAGYQTPHIFGPNPLLCNRHHVYTYGVLTPEGTLAAYLWLYRSGELAMVSSILGHADILCDNVMYLLFAGMLEEQAPLGGTVFYNLHSSGTDGLRFFKERLGFTATEVAWMP